MTITVGKLIEQELVTIARHYGVPEDPCPDTNILIAMAHEQLKKNFFENFERLIYSCVYQDREKYAFILLILINHLSFCEPE